jgi:hypothetical protein
MLLCYQDEMGNICLASGRSKYPWQPSITIKAPDVILGSSLAFMSFQRPKTVCNSIRLYYQAKDSTQKEDSPHKVAVFKELVWEGLHDDFQRTFQRPPVLGRYSCPSPPGASIAAVAWAEPDLEMRVFAGRSNFVVQHRFGLDEWSAWPLTVAKDVGGKQFAAGRLDSANVCLYFIDETGRVAETKDVHVHGHDGLEGTSAFKRLHQFLVMTMKW